MPYKYYICRVKYQNIKRAKITRERIAKALDYASLNAFNTSSANKRIMTGIDDLLGDVYKSIDNK